MIHSDTPLAFVDIETTGSQLEHDEIIEIAIIRQDKEQLTEFQQIFCPKITIPDFIQNLTGITNELVRNAPPIKNYLDTIQTLLKDAIFIAHNVAFDFSFIQYLFKQNNKTLDNTLLCTHKLAKHLYPEDKKHGIDFLIEKHRIIIPNRHRAYSDALAIFKFWQIIQTEFKPEDIQNAIVEVVKQQNPIFFCNPNKLNKLPKKQGVFILLDAKKQPLLIEKANNIQKKIKAYLRDEKNFRNLKLKNISEIKTYPCQSIFATQLTELKLKQQYAINDCKKLVYYSISIQQDDFLPIRFSIQPTNYQKTFFGLFKSSKWLEKKLLHELNRATEFLKKYHNGIPFNTLDELNHFIPENTIYFNQDCYSILKNFPKYEWPFQTITYYSFGNEYFLFKDWQFITCIQKGSKIEENSLPLPHILEKPMLNQLKKHLNQLTDIAKLL